VTWACLACQELKEYKAFVAHEELKELRASLD